MDYSHDTLRQFLNGELSRDKATKIETAMLADQDLERRVMALDPFAPIAKEVMSNIPAPDHIAQLSAGINMTRPATKKWQFPRIAAALAIGLCAGWFIHDALYGEHDDWREEVAHYQALYVAQTIANLDTDPALIDAQFQIASNTIDLALEPTKLGQIEGLNLSRAQVLGYQNQPLIQIAYQGQNGVPIALCIIKKSKETDETLYSKIRGLAAASWDTETHQFLLIGDAPSPDIQQWTRQIQAVI